MRIKAATAVWRKQGSKIETTACIIANDKPQTSYRDLEKWRFPSIGGVYEFTFYFVKIIKTFYITFRLYRYYTKNMNKFLTKFKQIVDKSDRIVIEYWDCIGSDRSSRDRGSANNSHYLNLTHSLCSLSPPLSRCFIASNTFKSKVQRRTQYEPDRRVLFYYVGNIACDISGITTKAPCKAARISVRHVRIGISDFALRTFLPSFSITQYPPRSLVEKRFCYLFSQNIILSIFSLNW